MISGGIGKVHILSAGDVGLLDYGVNHAMLIHVIGTVWFSCNLDADELLVSGVRDLIVVGIESLDDKVPLVKHVRWTEPSEVITVRNDKHG